MKNKRIMKAFSILLILLVVGGLAGVSAGEASMDINQSRIDELTGLNFDYTPDSTLDKSPPLSLGPQQTQFSESIANSGTIRQFLGPDLQGVSVNWIAPFETKLRFQLAVQAISDALMKAPKYLYAHEPWTNKEEPAFVATLKFKSGKCGKMYLNYGYLCFEDAKGKFWWARFTELSDLNLIEDSGILGFVAGKGYFIEHEKSPVYLQVAEQKLLVRQLNSLLGKRVKVQGEMKKVPSNVTMNFPKESSYFAYGFEISEAFK